MGQRDADNKVKCEEEAGESPLWQLAASLCYGAERLREEYTKVKLCTLHTYNVATDILHLYFGVVGKNIIVVSKPRPVQF